MKSTSKPTTQQIRVIIADDHPIVRAGLAAMLRSQKDIKVVAEATDGAEVRELYDQLSPDVLMLDLRMPKKDGLQVVTELMSRRVPEPRIIVMTAYESEEDLRRAFKCWSQRLPCQRGKSSTDQGGNADGCRGTILASGGDR